MVFNQISIIKLQSVISVDLCKGYLQLKIDECIVISHTMDTYYFSIQVNLNRLIIKKIYF